VDAGFVEEAGVAAEAVTDATVEVGVGDWAARVRLSEKAKIATRIVFMGTLP
jgi:hypothetical protein